MAGPGGFRLLSVSPPVPVRLQAPQQETPRPRGSSPGQEDTESSMRNQLLSRLQHMRACSPKLLPACEGADWAGGMVAAVGEQEVGAAQEVEVVRQALHCDQILQTTVVVEEASTGSPTGNLIKLRVRPRPSSVIGPDQTWVEGGACWVHCFAAFSFIGAAAVNRRYSRLVPGRDAVARPSAMPRVRGVPCCGRAAALYPDRRPRCVRNCDGCPRPGAQLFWRTR